MANPQVAADPLRTIALAGTPRWHAQYPLGAEGDTGLWTLDGPRRVAEPDEQSSLPHLQHLVGLGSFQDDRLLFWASGGLRLRPLERDDPAAYVWLDPSAAEVFGQAPASRVWAIVWLAGAAIVPVALLTPPEKGRPPRLVHLIPGAPEDVLATTP